MDNNKLNEAQDMADDLHRRIQMYKEATLDPDATVSIPSIDHMSKLAEDLCKKLNALE